jgi:hypothetical protein
MRIFNIVELPCPYDQFRVELLVHEKNFSLALPLENSIPDAPLSVIQRTNNVQGPGILPKVGSAWRSARLVEPYNHLRDGTIVEAGGLALQ